MATVQGLIYFVLLSALLVQLNPPVHSMPLQQPMFLQAKVIRLSGNQMPGGGGRRQFVAPAQEVIVVAGILHPTELGNPLLSQQAMNSEILLRARSDTNGFLTLRLPLDLKKPGRVTILLVVPEGYYLNRFDEHGNFSSLSLSEYLDDLLVLVDDRNSFH
jgi:hypothetical protein